MATFEQAVDELYAEALEAGQQHYDWVKLQEKKEEDPSSSDLSLKHIEMSADAAFHRSVGARHALGRVLALNGAVGTREFPALKGRRPEPKQVWIRVVQWGIARGLEKQEELNKTLAENEQYRIAAANLGKDFEEYQDQHTRTSELA